jgi:hypothetical protein
MKSNTETKQLSTELTNLLLKKTGVKLEDIYNSARKGFITSNLDLLTTTELKRFEPILLSTKIAKRT